MSNFVDVILQVETKRQKETYDYLLQEFRKIEDYILSDKYKILPAHEQYIIDGLSNTIRDLLLKQEEYVDMLNIGLSYYTDKNLFMNNNQKHENNIID